VHGLSPGQVLDGKYQVLKELGRGAMGVVYEATHMALGRRVAVKTLLSEMSTDPQLADRFEREARAASAIGHPHIIDVFDLGRTPDGLLYMVMEKLEGLSMADMLQKQPRLSVGLAIHLMTQVLSGLSAAHKNGIVHRDLKPDNIFVTQSEERPNFVKIVDFGISKVLSSSTKVQGTRPGYAGTMVGTVMGTPLYMSPEQAIGQIEEIDHRTDIYAAGVVLYEILCGRTPYVGDSYPEIMGGLLEGKYPPPRSLRPDIPIHVEEVIAQAMQREIEKRFPSASAMRQALADGLADVTPPPAITSSASIGQPLPAVGDTSPFSLVEASTSEPKDRGPHPRRSAGLDPFAPPDHTESFLELADDGDLPMVPRPARSAPRQAQNPVPDLSQPRPAGTKPFVVKPKGTLAAEGGLSPKVKGYLLKGIGLLAILITGRVAWSFLSSTGSLHPSPAVGKGMTLRLFPDFATAQIDHIPAKPGLLELDLGMPHVFNATAPGRITRRFTFDGKPGATLEVRLPHAVAVPQPAEVPPLTAELAMDYPDQPRPLAEIDSAFVKLALYEDCLSGVAEAVGKGGKGKPRAEVLITCQSRFGKAEGLTPTMSELESAARDFLAAIQSSAKPATLTRTAQAIQGELLAARAGWQLEELAAEGKASMSSAWHLRRVTVFAVLWQRATLALPEKPELLAKRRAQFDEYLQALDRYAGDARGELSRMAGAGEVLRFAREMATLVDAGKRPMDLAILDGTRRLVAAFNGLILD